MNPNPTDPNNPNPIDPLPTDKPASTFNPPTDLSSAIPNPAPATPVADTNLPPSPIPNPLPANEPQPMSTPFGAMPQMPETNPLDNQPMQSNPIPNPTEPINQPLSTAPQPWAPPTPTATDQTSQPMPKPQPMPTFTAPQAETQPSEMPISMASEPVQPIPTFTPPVQAETPQPNSQEFMSNMPASGQSETTPQPTTSVVTDPAPTDLSHLIPTQNGEQAPVYTPPMTQPETLVVPPDGNGTMAPNIPTETKAGFPKWVIGAAVVLLLIVSAASAYFILGIGQPQNTSVPATQVQQKPLITPPIIVTSTPLPTATGSATGAGFGQFQQPTATGSSAADILRQRLGR